MSDDTNSLACPRCGSDDTGRRRGLFASGRVCHACRKRFTPPSPLAWRIVVAVVLAVPGLIFSGLAFVIACFVATGGGSRNGSMAGLGCVGLFGVLGVACFIQSVRELRGRPRKRPEGSHRDADAPREEFHPDEPATLPALVPRETAEAIVRRLTEKYGLRGVARKLGNFRASHLANAAKTFAGQMGDDETPLAFVDRSFLTNGKAGFLVTNRGLYSSLLRRVIWLKDVYIVSYEPPELLASLLPVPSVNRFSRLIVNGKRVYADQPLGTPDFWIELLIALAEAAREKPLPTLELEGEDRSMHVFRPDSPPRPKSATLETAHVVGEGRTLEARRIDDARWEQIEQAIRDLDRRDRPSLRLSADGAALDIRGGDGRYTLCQGDGGWVYYDSGAGEEEVELCDGHRCPAFYVCTDLDAVLGIARRFIETGAFE